VNNFTKFLDGNRQLGSTTRLVELAIGSGGYLVVDTVRMKQCLVKRHPRLDPDQIITLHDIKNGATEGREQRPIFVDAPVLLYVARAEANASKASAPAPTGSVGWSIGEPVEVSSAYLEDGPEGPGWYAWEVECPEEGYFWAGDAKPTAEELRAVCPTYVESMNKHRAPWEPRAPRSAPAPSAS